MRPAAPVRRGGREERRIISKRTGKAWSDEAGYLELDRDETAEALRGRFGWKHGPFSSLLIRLLSLVLEPLETGTYRGRPMKGDPHKSYPVRNTPLTVFVMPDVRRLRLFLAARLRDTGPLNIIRDPFAEVKPGAAGGQGRKFGSLRLETLVNIQRASAERITIVPVTRSFHQHLPEAPPTMLFTRIYVMFAPMHAIRRLGSLLRTVRTARLRNTRPIDLAEWLEGHPQTRPFSQSTALHDEILGRIESEHRASSGPPIPQPWEARKAVLTDPILQEFIVDYSAETGVKLRKINREVRSDIREIASKIRVGAFRIAGQILNVGFDRLLSEIDIDTEGLRLIAECDTRSRVMIVCGHKSYMDPLILTYGIVRSGFTPPQQAAGINLNIWPLGWVLRRCGGFFMRRRFFDQPVYREAFNAYVRELLSSNYITAFYIEGTRSRDGKMRKPKTGLVKVLDDAVQYGACDAITVFPLYLGYDRVPEEGAHVKEMMGGHKIEESWGVFKRLYRNVTTTLGRAYMRFGPPLDFRTAVSEHGVDAAADLICGKIDEATVVTARSLASAALLSSGRGTVPEGEFREASDMLLEICRELWLPLAPDADREGVAGAVNRLVSEERVAVERDGDGLDLFRVEGDMRRFLEFNKNILLAHLLGPALAALAGSAGEEFAGSLAFLMDLFAEEFTFGPGFEERLNPPGDPAGAELLCTLLDSFLEGYLVTCDAVGSVVGGWEIERDEMVRRCFAHGLAMTRSEEGGGPLEAAPAAPAVRRRESLSRIIFENALKRFSAMGLLVSATEAGQGGRRWTVLARGDRFDELGDVEERIASFLRRD